MATQKDIFHLAGVLFLGTRLKRAGEKFIRAMESVYKTLGIAFDPTWFPVFFLLSKKSPQSLVELSQAMEVTHSAVSQWIQLLKKKNLVRIAPDAEDNRVKKVSLSAAGEKLLAEIQPVWDVMVKELQVLMNQFPKKNLLGNLENLETILNSNLPSEKIIERLKKKKKIGNR